MKQPPRTPTPAEIFTTAGLDPDVKRRVLARDSHQCRWRDLDDQRCPDYADTIIKITQEPGHTDIHAYEARCRSHTTARRTRRRKQVQQARRRWRPTTDTKIKP